MMKKLSAAVAAGLLLIAATSARADVTITINPNLSTTLSGSGSDDVFMNVVNNSSFGISQLHLVSPGGNNLFEFDGDGPFGGGYSGPNSSFGPVNTISDGFVNFTVPLAPGSTNNHAFGLESEHGSLPGDLQVTVTIAPEPASLAIFGVIGLVSAGVIGLRRR